MKILFLIDTLGVGGSEKSLLEILARFRKTEAVLCHLYTDQTLKPEYEAAGIRVISSDISEKYAFGTAVKRIINLIKMIQPDGLHTTLFRADIVGRIAGYITQTPVISSFVNETYHPSRWRSLSVTGQIKLKGIQIMDSFTAKWVKHFVAVSEASKLSNCKALRISPNKVSVIYRGRDPKPILSITEEQIADLRDSLNFSEETRVILNVGRLLHRKGQLELVQAMPLVLNAFPSAKLLVAGDGPDSSMIESVIKECNVEHAVHLLGTRNDIPQLLHLADTFVFPSHYEGYPGALIEAMFAARPIVASSIPVHQETIEQGKTGLLVSVQKPEELAKQIIWMLDHVQEARVMGIRVRQKALERFHIDHIATQHEQMYDKVIHSRST